MVSFNGTTKCCRVTETVYVAFITGAHGESGRMERAVLWVETGGWPDRGVHVRRRLSGALHGLLAGSAAGAEAWMCRMLRARVGGMGPG
jgi:hypothetical protein